MKKLNMILMMGLFALCSCYTDNEPNIPQEDESQIPQEEKIELTQELLYGYLEGGAFYLNNIIPLKNQGNGTWTEVDWLIPGVGTIEDWLKVHPHRIIWLRDGKVFLEYHYTYGMLWNMFEHDTSSDNFSNFNLYSAENNFFGSPFFIPAEWKYDAQTHQLTTPNQAMELEEDEKVGYFIESCNEEELIMRVEYGEPRAWGHDCVRFIYKKESETPVQYRDFNSRKEFDLWFEQLVANWRASVNN